MNQKELMIDYRDFVSVGGKIKYDLLETFSDIEIEQIKSDSSFLMSSPTLRMRLKVLLAGISEHPQCICGNPVSFSKDPGKTKIFNKFCSKRCADDSPDRKQHTLNINIIQKENRETFKPHPHLSVAEVAELIINNKDRLVSRDAIRKFLSETEYLKESIYFHAHNIKRESGKVLSFILLHSCEMCGKNTDFISFKSGFKKRCREHTINQKIINSVSRAKYNVEKYGFSVAKLPEYLNEASFGLCCSDNHHFSRDMSDGRSNGDLSRICPECFPHRISRPEWEIKEWLETFGIEVIQQYPIEHIKTSKKTIDLYLPKYKIGLEYDGVLNHSYGKSKYARFNNYMMEDKNKHLHKTKLCEEQGIQLLHIFSSEWLANKDLWKSVILSKLNMLPNKIYGRRCVIKAITSTDANIFLNENHLQGEINSSIRYGLFCKDELVAVGVFGKSRYTNSDHELLRFASVKNTSVIGGFQKILAHFFKHNASNTLVSYANRRWSNGNVYKTGNFELINISKPNYFYFQKEDLLQSRVKFQKHKLNHDFGNTETEIMFNMGYRRIWDCGNLVYKYTNNNKE
jgi:hypothetical protein